ncbi:MnhG: multisubunit Na+/H+ antiporter, MnhG subunit [Desulfosarcina variabilis str. Montpellier]|jgi:multicomponent Na+:H+ antiporter subunit G|uniref:monovalent cation/H(+) antiporter subunit G n=1 Tax=Desulfosarcina variabilis TaxID=2300 RepID=UPI003AFA0E9F
MISVVGKLFIGIGLAFDVLGCLGLVRLPDVYNRLQAATKCVTLGTCSILFGTFLTVGFTSAGIKSLLCIVFLLLTAPVAAHAIARGGHRGGVALWKGSVVDAYAADKDKDAPVEQSSQHLR